MSIQAIDRTSVHRLTSGQVIIDLQTAVKELVENALDAGATTISVKFREHGLDEIEVEDNGRGIEKEDWPGLALKHHTSKLTSFDDLASVSTLGFRGEALASLCGVATLSITTCTSPSLPLGTALSFTHAGELRVDGSKRVSRSRGTTVKVEQLFENLPVRRKELSKNAKREMGKAIEMVQAYALINLGVRFEVRNVVKGKSQVLLQTPISTTLRANFSNLFAPKSLASLLDLDLTLEVPTEKTVMKRLEGGTVESSTIVRVKGLISKPSAPHGRPAGNRQFYYINGRPFSPAKVAKAVNESYKSFNANQFPTVVADFQLAPDAYDVNVSPDKRTIFLHSEGNLIACLKDALARFFEPEKGTFPMQAIGPAVPRSTAAAEGRNGPASPTVKLDDDEQGEEVLQEEEADMEPPRKKKRRDEDASPGPSRTRSTASSPSALSPSSSSLRATASRSSSIVVEVTNPIPPLQDDEVFLPEPPAHFYDDADEEEDTKPAVAELSDDKSPAPQAAVLNEDEGNGSPSLFRRGSSMPRPPPSRNRSPFEDEPNEPDDRPTHAAPGRPAPRLAQTKLTFLGGRGGSEEIGTGGRDSRGNNKSRTNSSSTTTTKKVVSSNGGGETSAGRMQGILRQFLNGTPRTSKDKAGEVDELEDDDVVFDDEQEPSASGEENLLPDRCLPRSRSITRATLGEESLDDHDPAPAASIELLSDEDDALVEQPDDVIMLVDESLCADSPAPIAANEDEDEDDLEVVAASCACVHGSQEIDLEIEIMPPPPPPPPPPRGPEEPAPVPTPLPFGAAASEVAGTLVAADAQLQVDLANLEQIWTAAGAAAATSARNSAPNKPTAVEDDPLAGAGIDERDEAAEATLSRVVSKADFEAMQVVGQFNLGFIIARRRVEMADSSEVHDDLFIVDQHASDEKYNFERLQAETVIQAQRLLAPRVLNLPSADEITAMEHLDVLRLNGFDVEVDENAGVGERVKLTAQPVSRDTVFDVGDLEELVEMIATSGGAEVVRPTKARRMFASRACRKSVMIGKALNHKQMTTILRHMGGMEQPWACPHGRPTMRWLAAVGGGASKTPAEAVGLRDAVAVLGHASM